MWVLYAYIDVISGLLECNRLQKSSHSLIYIELIEVYLMSRAMSTRVRVVVVSKSC
jgi:hypothetical protein